VLNNRSVSLLSSNQVRASFAFMVVLLIGGLSGCASSTTGNSAVQITPNSALLSLGQKFQFNAISSVSTSNNFLWEVNGVVGGSASTGTITSDGVYTAPNSSTNQPVSIGIQQQGSTASVSFYDPNHPTPGTVAATQNPLVAAYTVVVPDGGSAQVQFGTDTSYGLNTSSVSPTTGGTETIYVAGMRASTTYHMQAITNLADGTQVKDADHTFQTGAIPAAQLPNITTQLTGAGTPSPGVELMGLVPNATSINQLAALATDLSGNVIWYYAMPTGAYPEPIKLLPNGHMLMLALGGTACGQGSAPNATCTLDDAREIDLAGNIINDVTVNEVNQSLPHIADFQITQFTHDVLELPNGHLIILCIVPRIVNGVTGIPDGTIITGDAVVDWDPQANQVVWAWSVYDHLSYSHAPYGLSDWTHSNALYYSQDDGNLLLSLRNQNWILKLNYQDGAGDGSILWHFGPDGDFTLPNGQAPIEWNYGQHGVTIQSPNTSGIFSLMFFNNGTGRLVDANNDVCGTTGQIACYSSVPIFQVNEYTKTASVLWEDKLAPAYSICCGDALILPTGNVEFDVAYDVNTPNVSYVEEVTQTQSPELIWRMNITNQLAYRAFRISSLYPGVTWPSNAQPNSAVPNSTPKTYH
jgi:arylsulfate sulfotransferase